MPALTVRLILACLVLFVVVLVAASVLPLTPVLTLILIGSLALALIWPNPT